MTLRTQIAAAGMAGAVALAGIGSAAPSAGAGAVSALPRTCSTYFVASVTHGPDAGSDHRGVLSLRLDRSGSLTGGSFAAFAGGRVAVTASVHGGAIRMTIPTRDGTLVGTGRVDGSLGQCVGRMTGRLAGPGRRDRGSWLATSGQTLTLPNGSVLITAGESANHPNPQVVYRSTSISAPLTVFAGALNTPGNIDGQRLAARMNRPSGLAYDAARSVVYIADVSNGSIRSLNMSTNQVATALRSSDFLAAAHAAGYPGVTGWEPQGVALSPGGGGAILVTDARNFAIWKYNPATAQLRLFAGLPGASGHADGSDTAVRFSAPQQIAVSSDGLVAVAEPTANRVRLRDPSGNGSWSTIGT
jgi:DNA-binding beta-propeller fold protein YncE